MPQIASRPEEEVRHALKVLAAASPMMLDEAISSMQPEFGTTAAALRNVLVYRSAVDSLERALVTLPTVVDPATARAVQATENVWRRIATEFGLLSSSEVSSLLGASNANRAFTSELRKRGELLAAPRKNAYVFPGFQFNHESGTVRAWVVPLLRLAQGNERSAADVSMWMMSPTTYFDGDRPADHVDDAQRLLSVAERAWSVGW